ncbi:MAG: nickel pincer cofactor biosynthesis protein LarC [Ktedonobacteraceae bacterium]
MSANVAYLDCSAGISGELFLAALLDAGFSLERLENTLNSLPVQGYQLKHTPIQEQGVRGSHFAIVSSSSSQATHSLAGITALLQTATLPAHIRETSLSILHRLEEAYGAIAGLAVHEAFFSEAEMLSAVICIVGVVLGVDALALTQIYASPLPLTSGSMETAQGLQLLPPPIALEVLREVAGSWQPSAREGHLVTPVGAALLAALASFESPIVAIARVGYAFDRIPPSIEHCVRLYVGRQQPVPVVAAENEPVEDADTDWVAVIESHIDNMTGELLGGLMERLLALGALDVSYTPLQMKKNRPATLVTVICAPEQGERFALTLLRETSTLGVRIQQVRRLKAQREQRSIDTPLGPIIVKIKRLGSRVISIAPEYEECRRIALAQSIPLADVYESVHRAIQNVII